MTVYKEVLVALGLNNKTPYPLQIEELVEDNGVCNRALASQISPQGDSAGEYRYESPPDKVCLVRYRAKWAFDNTSSNTTEERSGAAGVMWIVRAAEQPDGTFQLQYELRPWHEGYLRCVVDNGLWFNVVEADTAGDALPVPTNTPTAILLTGARTLREAIIKSAKDQVAQWDALRAQQHVEPPAPLRDQTEARKLRRQYFEYAAGKAQLQGYVDNDVATVDAIVDKEGKVVRTASGVPHWCGMFAFWNVRQAGVPGYRQWADGSPQFEATGPRPLKIFSNPQLAQARLKPGDVLGGLNQWNHHVVVTSLDGSTFGAVSGNAGGGNAHQSYALSGSVQNTPGKLGVMYCTVPAPACTQRAAEKKSGSCPAVADGKWQCPAFHGPRDWNLR